MSQLLFLTTHYKTKINDYVDDFPLYKIPAYIIKKRNKNHDHGKCLYRQWTKPIIQKHKTKKPHTTPNTIPPITAIPKDDPSNTSIIETLYTLTVPSTHASRAKLLSIYYQYWCHLKHYNLESTNNKVPNTDPTPCLYPPPIPGKSQYCCMVCFDWCIRQNAPYSQIPSPDVYLY